MVRTRTTPALMLQGASSNAGKSVLAAGFCRMLLQDGYRVAPFKAQNMSLNSFVTPDGREIGRAQATQAAACRLEPDARMNPVLLKPTSERGSQVMLLGRPVGVMQVAEYVRYKHEAFARAKEAYDSLAAEHDVMVLEGAGSPAEVNLKHHDMVNMAMAAHAGARVLLAGDIDRGGVFASFVGTWELLEPAERALLLGWVVNRFRGDPSLLDPALDFMEQRTGVPVLGVVPHVRELGLPEEDSVSFKEALCRPQAPRDGEGVDVVLVDLPHIANFTDLDALRVEPDVRVRTARRPEDLAGADAVVLPGSKNTLADLEHLRATGMADALLALAREGRTQVVGVCGGFQMLGRTIADPGGLESDLGSVPGLGLLDAATELGADKILERVRGVHPASGEPVFGYEIHHGRTVSLQDGEPLATVLTREDGAALGFGSATGMVWGSYLHGLFDADGFRRLWVDGLRAARGLEPLGAVQCRYSLEPALDRLADHLRAHTRWRDIYAALGL